MKKRFLALAMATTLVAGCLTGCGKDDNDSKDSTAATETQKSDSDSDTTQASSGTNSDAVNNLIAATDGTVSLTVWASEEDQDFTQGLIDEFAKQYPDVTFDIKLGACSEADAKDTVLTDIEAAADVFTFADDQMNELVNAGALQEVVSTYTYDVKAETLAGAVEAASMNGKLYAYPMTADNGYFLYYDSSVFSESDVESLDKMLEVADAAGKQVAMEVSGAWYNYSFFKGAGYDVTLNDDGVTNSCTWNADGATDVAQAIIDIGKSSAFLNAGDADIVTGITEGKIAAAVSGTWNADTIKAAWGDGYAATKLPTYTVAGKQVQMASFSGYKLIGVNSHSKNVGWAMILAEFLTNEENQVARFNARSLGPANAKAAASSDVQSNPAIAALAKQADYAVPQRVGGNYWEPANTLGLTLISGNPDGTDLQKLLDNAVECITAPVQ
ncbi:MAG: extracellular solute-binding protein [Lachnospiraceae bacterium]|nr:extracellular solute-binding protein [Lachnospiraceae bacterium]